MPKFEFNMRKKKKKEEEKELITVEEALNPCFYKKRSRHNYRRAISEVNLMDVMNSEKEFLEGYSYHFLSAGDIDIFSYLKFISRRYTIDYLILSTWAMAKEDVLQIEEMFKSGIIKEIHFCLGEIYKTRYINEYHYIKNLMKKYKIKLTIFRNHSKVITGKAGNFYFNIESSANVNTNPRTENTVISIDKGLHEFYKKYYTSIKTIDG